jgi:hypothetical protein
MRSLLLMVFALALVASLAVPAGAQSDSAKTTSDRDATKADDAAWFSGLGKHRQDELKKRHRALKRLPKEKQEAILKAAKDGKPILSEEQRKNLGKLRKLSYLQRVRLYTLAAELNAARNFRPAEFRKAMESDDRTTALRHLLAEQRATMFMRTLPEERRRELMRLPMDERKLAIKQVYEQESKERLAELETIYPRVNELREAAKTDKEARRQFKQLMGDIKTLDLLLLRLEPERRKQVMAELRDLSMDEAANTIRKALKDQWQEETKRNKEDREKDRKEGRNPPDRNGNRSPENRRRPRGE